MKAIQDTGAWFGKNRYHARFEVLDLKKQVIVLLDEFGHQHLYKKKINGDLNKKHRAYAVFQFLDDVHAAGFKIHNILNLGQKHVAAAVKSWIEKDLAAATIQTRLSHLRWFTVAMGKRGLIMPPTHYGLAAESVARIYVATQDKSWPAHGVLPAEMVQKASAMDLYVGAQLEAMQQFGLRVTEAILFDPITADRVSHLYITAGTKGGKPRTVLVQNDEQRASLVRLKVIAATTDRGSLVPPGKKPKQARNRLYYVCRKLGITRDELGVTAHGLRHGHANDLYEGVAGFPSVVRGGPPVLDRAADELARRVVSLDLGHQRTSITASYTGRRPHGRPPSADAESPSPAGP